MIESSACLAVLPSFSRVRCPTNVERSVRWFRASWIGNTAWRRRAIPAGGALGRARRRRARPSAEGVRLHAGGGAADDTAPAGLREHAGHSRTEHPAKHRVADPPVGQAVHRGDHRHLRWKRTRRRAAGPGSLTSHCSSCATSSRRSPSSIDPAPANDPSGSSRVTNTASTWPSGERRTPITASRSSRRSFCLTQLVLRPRACRAS